MPRRKYLILCMTSLFLGVTSLFISCKKDVVETASYRTLPDVFVDTRDGHSYYFITIGEQVWMAENLRYLPAIHHPEDTSSVEPKFYVYDYFGTDLNEARATDNYRIYGALYNWANALDGAEPNNENPSGIKGICPEGWHLPSISEFEQLVDHLGGSDVAGGALKAVSDLWEEPNWNATDSVGFGALPGGFHHLQTGTPFWGIGLQARFHSTTVTGFFDTPRGLTLHNTFEWALLANGHKRQARCVRCIKNAD